MMPAATPTRACTLIVALAVCALTGCRITDWRLWDRGTEAAAGPCEVTRIRDIAYHHGPGADKHRHSLDLYLPKGKKDFPVVVLVHGGAWIMGDNRCCGLSESVGEFLASQGIAAALPNYRLSPFVKHPEHIKDVARAFAWVKKRMPEHGGRTDQMFLVGHSAGGHLVALLATDEQYLCAEGCRGDDIRGVVCLSGIFHVPDGKVDLQLGGTTPTSMRLDAMMPLRGGPGAANEDGPMSRGLPISFGLASTVFGDDPRTRLAASPLHHVRPGLPPFLFLSAQRDLPILPEMADEMHQRLRLHGCVSSHRRIENSNHNSVMFKAIEPNDPTARAIVDFVHSHAR